MSSVSKVSDSIVLSVPLPVASVVMSPGSVAVADAGGGGGGGATPQVVISPARAEKDSTTSNVTAAQSFCKCFMSVLLK